MPTKSGTTQMNCIYEGSVKRVWQPAAKPDRLWFEFTDDYSVFDWGKMPDTIADKGKALTAFGAYFFQQLSKKEFWQSLNSMPVLQQQLNQDWWQKRTKHPVFAGLQKSGLPSHFIDLVDETGSKLPLKSLPACDRAFLEVVRAHVPKVSPASLNGQTIYYYPLDSHRETTRLVPLEVVFRFGMPSGSSLKARLEKNPQYARQLGLTEVPREGKWFDRPVLEFFTKLEPKDRLLTLQEAVNISTLSVEQFEELSELALAAAVGLFALFAERGIELWDGKFEFIISDGKLLLADSIGPDELRLISSGAHLSKEFIRQIYRDTAWEKAIKEAQNIATGRGADNWKQVCTEELGKTPDPLDAPSKALADALYPSLFNTVAGEAVFSGQPELVELSHKLNSFIGGKQK
ncbi:MAG: phosphoribosylaminoimidazolesuccinocarboxamide synthase [Candidatus Obscuribacterales bacterium]